MHTSRLAFAIMLAVPAVFARTARADPLLGMHAPMLTEAPTAGTAPEKPGIASVADPSDVTTTAGESIAGKAQSHVHSTPPHTHARKSWKAPAAPVKAAPAAQRRAALQTSSPASTTDAQLIERLRKQLSTKDAEIAALRAELRASRAVATVQLVPTAKAAEHAPAKESPTVIALSASQLNREGMAAMSAGNYGVAVEKFRRAADLNDVAATANLGTLYLNGYGVTRNPFQALQLLSRAANGGNRTAAENLGTLSEYGIGGVARNPVRAYQWYEVAARLGSATVQTSMARIKAQGY